MPRIARAVAPGYPHHVTQRGNRRQPTFFPDGDYQAYVDLMDQWCRQFAVGKAHRGYTRMINFREGWRGHIWQERF